MILGTFWGIFVQMTQSTPTPFHPKYEVCGKVFGFALLQCAMFQCVLHQCASLQCALHQCALFQCALHQAAVSCKAFPRSQGWLPLQALTHISSSGCI